MWNRASSYVAGTISLRHDARKTTANEYSAECSDEEASSVGSREEGLECPICWESFNLVENIPYVLWCGHTLCKNCILGLQWAVVKFPTLPLQLPLLISCPWCNLLSLRLVYRGNLKFPRKNFFLLWMLESMNGDRVKTHSFGAPGREHFIHRSHDSDRDDTHHHFIDDNYNYFSLARLHVSLRKPLVFVLHLTAKFPLVIIFLLIILYVIPASAALLALYVLITLVFALPSFLILYFAYPCLDWLVREIIT
ncbi:RING/U-box superfamily protein [Striga hermonthica]|uniref:RING/U-box superfamily protein n=1 Tax=Striga hermonthica TaxID=68872 RepID=A0A9N7RJ60_STRHE|nr:RING/U-box superfamily protein [Striga hermonthica]